MESGDINTLINKEKEKSKIFRTFIFGFAVCAILILVLYFSGLLFNCEELKIEEQIGAVQYGFNTAVLGIIERVNDCQIALVQNDKGEAYQLLDINCIDQYQQAKGGE